MTFIESARESPPYPSSLAPEVAALRERRCELISQLAELADEIRRIDDRLHILRINAEMDRERTESEARAEDRIESRKEAGEA
jgi:hypothetical protein